MGDPLSGGNTLLITVFGHVESFAVLIPAVWLDIVVLVEALESIRARDPRLKSKSRKYTAACVSIARLKALLRDALSF